MAEKCFQLKTETGEKHALNYRLSPTNAEPPSPWPDGTWRRTQITTDEEGYFDAQAVEQMPKHWMVFHPIVREIPDVIGEFSKIEIAFPAISVELKEMIEAVDPELCHFVKAGRMWDLTHDCEVTGRDYYFTSVRKMVDAVDPDSDLDGGPELGARSYFLTQQTKIRKSAISQHMLWRDRLTRVVMCNEEFRERAQAVGCSNISFYPLKVDEGR